MPPDIPLQDSSTLQTESGYNNTQLSPHRNDTEEQLLPAYMLTAPHIFLQPL